MNIITTVVFVLSLFAAISLAAEPANSPCHVTNKTVYDCSNRNLTAIPSDINATATSIDLRRNNLGNLTGKFLNFDALKTLWLDSSQLTALAAEAFKGCKALQTLSLGDNKLASLDDNQFNDPPLTMLNLSYNQFTDIPGNAFVKLVNVTQLELSHLNKNGPLNNNTLGTNFANMTKLTTLSLQGIGVQDVGGSYLEHVSVGLTTLDLSYNMLTKLGNATFSQFNKLTALELNDNQIASIDEDAFTNLNALNHLSLGMNKLNNISAYFCKNTPQLQYLTLCGFQGSSIPDTAFANCTSLQTVHMTLTGLQKLDLAFANLKNLTTLVMRENGALELRNKDSFKNCTSLVSLDLYGMAATLRRSYYNLPEAITAIPHLQELNIAYSCFTAFSNNDTKFFGKLKHVDATQNPFNCACKNSDWLEWFQKNSASQIPAKEKALYNCTTCDQCDKQPLGMADYSMSHCAAEERKSMLKYAVGSALVGLTVGILLTALVVYFMVKKRRGCFAGVSYGGLSESSPIA